MLLTQAEWEARQRTSTGDGSGGSRSQDDGGRGRGRGCGGGGRGAVMVSEMRQALANMTKVTLSASNAIKWGTMQIGAQEWIRRRRRRLTMSGRWRWSRRCYLWR